MTYLKLHAHNPNSSIFFYSKFLYAPNSESEHPQYWWIGFSLVGLVLVFLRLLRALIEKGIIKWNFSTVSSDEDMYSPPNTFLIGNTLLTDNDNM